MHNETTIFKVGKTAFEAGIWKLMKARLRLLFPKLHKTLGLESYAKEHSKLCMDFITEVIQHRKATGMYRPDFVEILMRLRAEENDDGKVSTGEGRQGRIQE